MRAFGEGREKFTVRINAFFFPLRILARGEAPIGFSRLSFTFFSTSSIPLTSFGWRTAKSRPSTTGISKDPLPYSKCIFSLLFVFYENHMIALLSTQKNSFFAAETIREIQFCVKIK